MAMLLVTFESKTLGKDYSPLYKAITDSSLRWWHYMDNVWIVEANISADAYARKLFPYFTTNDRLLVVRITAESQGWLPKEAWDWLRSRNY